LKEAGLDTHDNGTSWNHTAHAKALLATKTPGAHGSSLVPDNPRTLDSQVSAGHDMAHT
jgi:hypothetical protein